MLDPHPNAKVIDLASGKGDFTLKIRERIKCREILGVDVWENALREARNKGINVDRLIADAAEIVILQSTYHLSLMKKLANRPIEIVYSDVEAAEKIPNKRGDYLIAVARWEHGKRASFLLDVLQKLKEKGCTARLVMVGPWKSPKLREDRSLGMRLFIILGGF